MVIETKQKLNKAQQAAATFDEGPLLLVAGAGTGKTTVLIERLVYLLLEKKVNSDAVLLLTFTDKASGEMAERADKALPYGYFDLWISTFHGFCEKILRQHALDIGLNSEFKLITATEQWILMKQNLKAFKLNYYRPLGNPTKFLKELLRHFSRLKDEAISAENYLVYTEGQVENLDSKLSGAELNLDNAGETLETERLQELAGAFQTYNQLLLDNNWLDFGDLITYTLKLFKDRPNILNYYREQFKYVMVDEFQDVNFAQYELVKLLVAPKNNLVVVGDDDQAIYRFRGASLSNIMQFKDDFPGAKEIILNENYRSAPEILDLAYKFIQNNNPNRLEVKLKIDKRLIAAGPKKNETKSVALFNYDNVEEEISFVAAAIKEMIKLDPESTWSDYAILVRANDTAEKYLPELKRQEIPHQFVSLKGLYYKPLILDLSAYFKLLDNYHESPALYRVLNMDVFKVSYQDLVLITKTAKQKTWSLYEALKNINLIKEVSPEALLSINKLLQLIEKHSLLAKSVRPSRLFLDFLQDSKFINTLDRDLNREEFSYLDQFYKKIKSFEENLPDSRLKDFVELLDLEREAGESGSLRNDFEDADVVKVMTVHSAKGLEFKYVFLVDLVEQKFPTSRRGEQISLPLELTKEKIAPDADWHLEEERRLFYVALTRAKSRLFLTLARDYGGARAKKPSRFLIEAGLENEIKLSEIKTGESLLQKDLKNQSDPDSLKKPNYKIPDEFSFSQLSSYESCPLQYKFATILQVPVFAEKDHLLFGNLIHNTLKDFLTPLLSGQQKIQADLFGNSKSLAEYVNSEKLLELYKKHWRGEGYSDKEQQANFEKKGKQILLEFQKKLSEQIPEVLFLEKGFNFKVGDVSLKGRIDRIDKLSDGTLEIIDYKTGKPKDKIDKTTKRQLLLYQLFLEPALDAKVSRLSYYYLDNNEPVSFTGNPKDLSELENWIIETASGIKSGNFAPKPSEFVCKNCDYRGICEFCDN